MEASLYSVSSLPSRSYDLVCVGSGWAARPIAARVVAAGFTALIIDNELMGGDCPFWACVPSKCLLRPSEALEAAKAMAGSREAVTKSMVDAEAVFRRRDAFTRNWDDERLLVPAILQTGCDLVRGKGKLTGEKIVSITSTDGHSFEVTARHAVAVCTGSVPRILDIAGLEEAGPWTPREATSSSTCPEHLVVLGAGAVGCELATAYASLGSRITIITHGAEILPAVDHEAAQIVRMSMEAKNVTFHLGTSLTRVERKDEDTVEVLTSTGLRISASRILVAAGRTPRTWGCGLEAFGLPTDGTPIPVDDSMRVKGVSGWLYAVGDVNGRSPLTHMCKYQGRIAAAAIIHGASSQTAADERSAGLRSASADHGAVPQVIFTQPTVATMGLTKSAADKQGRAVRIVRAPESTVGALLHGDNLGDGWAHYWACRWVGYDATELIHGATVAIAGGLRLEQLAHAVPCFPTMSEVYLNLLEAAGL